MKIYIPSKGRADTIKTHKLLPASADWHVVVHTEKDKASYLEADGFTPDRLIVSGAEYRIGAQRQWIKDNLVEHGEWFMMLDDNIERFHGYDDEHYAMEKVPKFSGSAGRYPHLYEELPFDKFMQRVDETVQKANELGAWYAGFASNPNQFFRVTKWRSVGFVISKIALVRKGSVNYDPRIYAMDDYEFSAANLLKYGAVCINSFVSSDYQHNERGGIGTYEERLRRKIEDCKILMETYPGLFRYKSRKNADPRAELVMRLTSSKQVDKWRHALQAQIQS